MSKADTGLKLESRLCTCSSTKLENAWVSRNLQIEVQKVQKG